jgi:adenylate cyclase
MSPVGPQVDAARSQLERILGSSGFVRNERLSLFLRFVVERRLEGCNQDLKETVIAVEVFGRSPGFDPKRDPIVRTEASRLRARLNEYYLNGGRTDSLIIDLPKGGYTPVFHQHDPPAEFVPKQGNAARQPQVVRLRLAAAVACIVAAAGVAVAWRVRHQSSPIPIAVLPLEDPGHDAEGDYFSEGLTSEIIRDLSIIDGLAVRSQTSSLAFKGKPRDIREAGKQLNADYILEGSVFRVAQQLRINVQLIRVRDDFPVWSARFDRKLADVIAIQDEISRGIVNSLRLNLGRGRRRYEISTEAYDLYLRGRALQLQHALDGYDQSIDLLQRAISKDPTFAPAYAALAVAYVFRSGQFRFDIADQLRGMQMAADEAIRLDPLLPEGHYALGMVYSRDGEWQRAEKSFRRAIELNPGDSQPYHDLAFFVLFPLGRAGEALKQLQSAENLDPLGPQVQYEMADVLMSVGRYSEAEVYCNKLPADFELKNECVLWARLRQGKINDVIQSAERALDRRNPGAPLRAILGCAYARAGRRQDAERLAADSTFNSFNEAHIRVCLGDQERTFKALDRATAAGPFRIGRAVEAPEYALIRGDSRLKSLFKKVGLPR